MSDLLRGYEVEQDEDDKLYGFPTGEFRLSLDFAEGVQYDVDVHSDGTIIVQYWGEERK